MRLSSYQRHAAEYGDTAFLDPRAVARSFLLYVGADTSSATIEKFITNKHVGSTMLHEVAARMSHTRLPPAFTTDTAYYTPPTNDDIDDDPTLVAHMLELNMFSAEVNPLLGQLHDLPPAMIATCDYDILRDEGAACAFAVTQQLQAICMHGHLANTVSKLTIGTTLAHFMLCSTSIRTFRWRRQLLVILSNMHYVVLRIKQSVQLHFTRFTILLFLPVT
jgi:hypothetical protein